MAIKVMKYTSTPISRYLRVGTSWNFVGRSNWTTSVTADAVWSRPKPAVLDVTPMIIRESSYNDTSYSSSSRRGDLDYVYPANIETIDINDDGTLAFTRALAKFTNASGTFGESLVESGSTAALIMKRGSQLLNIAKALRSANIPALERALGLSLRKGLKRDLDLMDASGRLSRGYLEVSFGVMPIVQNINDAAKLYTNGMLQKGQTVRSRSGNLSYGRPDWSKVNQALPEGSARIRAKVVNSRVANANAMGLLNIPLEVWNAVPFSFVFDWTGNIGVYLSSLTGGAGLGNSQVSVTTVTGRVIKKKPPSPVAGVTYSQVCTYTRTKGSLSPVLPTSWVRQSAFDFGKIVTLAALGRSLFR